MYSLFQIFKKLPPVKNLNKNGANFSKLARRGDFSNEIFNAHNSAYFYLNIELEQEIRDCVV
jgi:hypothetical protein